MHDKYTYRISWSEEDQEFVGLCTEFPSLSYLAKSQEAAFSGIQDLVKHVINDLKTNAEPIPEPIAEKRFSGKFIVRVTPELHRDLTLTAMHANVSLNRYINSVLATAAK